MPSRRWAPPAQHQAKNWAKSGQTHIFWVDIYRYLSYFITCSYMFIYFHIWKTSSVTSSVPSVLVSSYFIFFILHHFVHPSMRSASVWFLAWPTLERKNVEDYWSGLVRHWLRSILIDSAHSSRTFWQQKSTVQTPIPLNGSLNYVILVNLERALMQYIIWLGLGCLWPRW